MGDSVKAITAVAYLKKKKVKKDGSLFITLINLSFHILIQNSSCFLIWYPLLPLPCCEEQASFTFSQSSQLKLMKPKLPVFWYISTYLTGKSLILLAFFRTQYMPSQSATRAIHRRQWFSRLIKASLQRLIFVAFVVNHKTWIRKICTQTMLCSVLASSPISSSSSNWPAQSECLRATCKLPGSGSLHAFGHSYWRQALVIKRWDRKNNKAPHRDQPRLHQTRLQILIFFWDQTHIPDADPLPIISVEQTLKPTLS